MIFEFFLMKLKYSYPVLLLKYLLQFGYIYGILGIIAILGATVLGYKLILQLNTYLKTKKKASSEQKIAVKTHDEEKRRKNNINLDNIVIP
jgi:Mn2+/Fe2+ NRAMP family transporter